MIFNSIENFDISKLFSAKQIKINNIDKIKSTIESYVISSIDIDAIGDADEVLKKYLKTVDRSKASFEGFTDYVNKSNISLKEAGITAKASSVGIGILKTALKGVAIVAISFAVTGFISWLDNVINRSNKIKEIAQEAEQKIKSINDKLKSDIETVDEYKEQFAELSQGIDHLTGKNLSLSTDDYNDFLNISNKLADVLPQLDRIYDENGNKILKLSGNINTITESLDDYIKTQSNMNILSMEKEMPKVFDGYKEDLKEINKEIEKLKSDYEDVLSGKSNINYIDVYEDKLLKFGIDSSNVNKYNEDIDSLGNIYKRYDLSEYMTTINNSYTKQLKELENDIFKKNKEFNNNINSIISSSFSYNKLGEYSKNVIQSIIGELDFNKIKLNGDYINSWESAKEYIERYIINPLNNVSDDTEEEFEKLLTDKDTLSTADYTKKFYEIINKIIKENNMTDGEELEFRSNVSNIIKPSEDLLRLVTNKLKIKDVDKYKSDFISSLNEEDLKLLLDLDVDCDTSILEIQEKLNDEKLEIKLNFDISSDENKNTINNVKSDIENLYNALEKLNNGQLSSADKIELFENYPDLYNKTSDLSIAIEDLAMNKLIKLKKELLELNNTTQIQKELDDFLNNCQNAAYGVDELSTELSNLKSNASNVDKINDLFNINNNISADNLSLILSMYPELSEDVAKYNANLITSSELIDLLNKAYIQDELNFKKANAEKLKLDSNFYQNVLTNVSDSVIDLAESYGIQIKNYANYSAAKIEIAQKMQEKINEIENATSMDDGTGVSTAMGGMSLAIAKATEINKILQDRETILNELLDGINLNFDTSFDNFGNDNDNLNGSNNEFDWVANSIENLNREIDNLNDKLENTDSFEDRLKVYDDLKSANDELITATQNASSTYEAIWNQKSSKISDKYKNQIMSNGVFSIQDFSGNETLYNLIVDAQNAYKKWQSTLQENQNAIEERNSDEEAKTQMLIEQKQLEIDINSLNIDSASSAKYKNSLLDKEKKLKDELLVYDLSLAKTDEERNKLQKEYNKYLKENAEQQYENTKSSKENRISYWDSKIQDYQNIIDLKETNDKHASKSIYLKQNQAYQAKIDWNKEVLKLALEKRNAAKYGTDEWNKYNEDIQNAQDAINQCTIAQIKNNEEILKLPFYKYEQYKDKLENISDELSDLISLLDDVDSYDDNAKLTNAGMTRLGLYQQQLQISYKSLDNVNNKIKKLNKQYANGLYINNENTYLDRLKEYQSEQRDAITNVNSYRKEILSLITDRINKEIEAKEKTVEVNKSTLDSEKELYEYKKSISDKAKDIATIEKKIAILNLSTSRKDVAERLKLQEELANKKQDLTDTEYNHSIDTQKNALDEELNSFKEIQEKKKTELQNNLNAQNQAINDSLSNVVNNYNTIYSGISTISQAYNLTLTDALVSPWESACVSIKTWKDTVDSAIGIKSNSFSDISNINSAKISSVLTKTDDKNQTAETELNKYIISKGYKKLTWSEMAKLGRDLGIKESTFKSVKEDGKLRMKILKKLKEASFSEGGYPKLVKQTGEDGIALVKNGESILTKTQTKIFDKFVDNLPIANNLLKVNTFDYLKLLKPITSQKSIPTIEINSPLINISGITKDEINREVMQQINNIPNNIIKTLKQNGVK